MPVGSIQGFKNCTDADQGDFIIFGATQSTDGDRAYADALMKDRRPAFPSKISCITVVVNVPATCGRSFTKVATGLTQAGRCKHLVGSDRWGREPGAVHPQQTDQFAMAVANGDATDLMAGMQFRNACVERQACFNFSKLDT